jgi:hypothetical protein
MLGVVCLNIHYTDGVLDNLDRLSPLEMDMTSCCCSSFLLCVSEFCVWTVAVSLNSEIHIVQNV